MSDKTTAIDPVLEIERLAEAAAGLTFEQLPGDVVRLAKLCLLDWFGVAIAASQEPVVEALAQMSGTLPNGSTVLGRRESCDVPDALLLSLIHI